jgi:hypothetical protein
MVVGGVRGGGRGWAFGGGSGGVSGGGGGICGPSSSSSPLLVVIRRGGRDVAQWAAVWWPCVLSWAVAALVSGVRPGGGVVGIGTIAGGAGGRRDMAAVAFLSSALSRGRLWLLVGFGVLWVRVVSGAQGGRVRTTHLVAIP